MKPRTGLWIACIGTVAAAALGASAAHETDVPGTITPTTVLVPSAPSWRGAATPSALPRPLSGRGARRPETPHRGDAVARAGDRHGSIARRAARDGSEARALLGDRVRLAQVRGEAQRPAAIHHQDRRRRHSFHSRAFEASERAADHRHARMARLDHRAVEDHRSADESHGAWRERGGRFRRRDSVAAGLRVFREAHRDSAGIPSASRARGSC